ncbi:MAG: cofactor-independent phosphoglycerate mutase [Deltaproteobacteria bacterium]|nr:cofactor-independent phosphoglycerate mutase [Deltaproteobacteria bacterium]
MNKHKYVILCPDGMADLPLSELGGKTPLEYAKTPNMDSVASRGVTGLMKTIPDGCLPGSDIGSMSILGYDPLNYYTGRSPLEAASMGVELEKYDVAFRLNLVNILHKDGEEYMHDYSGGHITTGEAKNIIETFQNELGNERFTFYPGVSYRHLLVVKNININGLQTVAPHDIPDLQTDGYLPHGAVSSGEILEIMKKAEKILENHDVNKKRIAAGKLPANSIWLWGQGYKPSMPTIKDAYGLSGSVISAVDLVKGIGKYAGLKVINVPGATGYLDTNYKGKVEYGMESLNNGDFAYIHVEATDEASHEGSVDKKIKAIEDFDKFIAGGVLEGLKKFDEYTLMILPDHYNQVKLKKHTPEPVPFCGFSTQIKNAESKYRADYYSEALAQNSGLFFDSGSSLFKSFLNSFKDFV